MRVFRPTISTTIATLVVFPLLVALGFWQLDRAAEKRALAAVYHANQNLRPIEINGAIDVREQQYQWVSATATGEFAQKTILLDNRIRDTKVGYEVLTPLNSDGITVLVNRGWVAAAPSRDELPDIHSPVGVMHLSGKLGPVPTTGIAINEYSDNIEELTDNFLRVQQIDLEQLTKILDLTLLNGVLYLDDDAPHGYLRHWSSPGFNPEKHEAYATQWFAMALIVGVLYIVLNLKPGLRNSG